MAPIESEVKALWEGQYEAIRTKNIERLMSLYSPDIVYFDVVPPLRFAGAAALRDRFVQWFAGFDGPIDLDVRDVSMVVNADIAVAHWLSRARGMLKNGHHVGSWARATSCCRRSHHQWLITHEHISLPVDVKSGTAVTDLVP